MAVNPIKIYSKDPTATLDYTIDWSDWLGLDTISSVTWTIPAGITGAGTVRSARTTTQWLTGGTVNTNYTVSCKITTAAGRTDTRSIQINVVAR